MKESTVNPFIEAVIVDLAMYGSINAVWKKHVHPTTLQKLREQGIIKLRSPPRLE